LFSVVPTNRFKRNLKCISRQNKNIDELETIVNIIAARDILPPSNRDHTLTGNYSEHRECHIEPDWLLIYRVDEDDETIILVRTGSHSDLFS
jgi:mRNA interferase YafQ